MSATLVPTPGSSATLFPPLGLLGEAMLAHGWSPDEIHRVQGALISVHLHDTYLQAGYSPDEIEQITSLY